MTCNSTMCESSCYLNLYVKLTLVFETTNRTMYLEWIFTFFLSYDIVGTERKGLLATVGKSLIPFYSCLQLPGHIITHWATLDQAYGQTHLLRFNSTFYKLITFRLLACNFHTAVEQCYLYNLGLLVVELGVSPFC